MSTYQRPQHSSDCQCSVCWTAAFCAQMHERNDSRQKRCHEILNNPLQARRPRFWELERSVKGTPFVGDILS